MAGGRSSVPGCPHESLIELVAARTCSPCRRPVRRESFYRDAGEPAHSAADAARPADWARLRQVAERSECIELLGPPPLEAAQQALSLSGAPS